MWNASQDGKAVMTTKEARIAYGIDSLPCAFVKLGKPCECRRCREAELATRIIRPGPAK